MSHLSRNRPRREIKKKKQLTHRVPRHQHPEVLQANLGQKSQPR